jgi:hypothetical protein
MLFASSSDGCEWVKGMVDPSYTIDTLRVVMMLPI